MKACCINCETCMCPFGSTVRENKMEGKFCCWAYRGKGMTQKKAINILRKFASIIAKHISILPTLNKMAKDVLEKTK